MIGGNGAKPKGRGKEKGANDKDGRSIKYNYPVDKDKEGTSSTTPSTDQGKPKGKKKGKDSKKVAGKDSSTTRMHHVLHRQDVPSKKSEKPT